MSIAKIQVPMDTALRDGLSKLASERGFDSVQAYIRFWAKNEVDGRQVTFREDEPWPAPSPELEAKWDREIAEMKEQEARGEIKEYTSVADFMKDL